MTNTLNPSFRRYCKSVRVERKYLLPENQGGLKNGSCGDVKISSKLVFNSKNLRLLVLQLMLCIQTFFHGYYGYTKNQPNIWGYPKYHFRVVKCWSKVLECMYVIDKFTWKFWLFEKNAFWVAFLNIDRLWIFWLILTNLSCSYAGTFFTNVVWRLLTGTHS